MTSMTQQRTATSMLQDLQEFMIPDLANIILGYAEFTEEEKKENDADLIDSLLSATIDYIPEITYAVENEGEEQIFWKITGETEDYYTAEGYNEYLMKIPTEFYSPNMEYGESFGSGKIYKFDGDVKYFHWTKNEIYINI